MLRLKDTISNLVSLWWWWDREKIDNEIIVQLNIKIRTVVSCSKEQLVVLFEIISWSVKSGMLKQQENLVIG